MIVTVPNDVVGGDRVIRDQLDRYWFLVQLDWPGVLKPRQGHIVPGVHKRIERDRPRFEWTLERIRPLAFSSATANIPEEASDPTEPHWNNGYFCDGDARGLIGMIGAFRPSRFVEIGSGNSTRFAHWSRRALETNTRITSIDPAPRVEIDSICDEVIRHTVLDVAPEFFASLESDDFLFIDGSHLTFNGTDTTYLFLEVLPRVRPGVIIHIHDIELPFDYSEEFTRRGYNEQYMLAILLLNNPDYEILLPVHYAASLNLWGGGGSFWMVRTR